MQAYPNFNFQLVDLFYGRQSERYYFNDTMIQFRSRFHLLIRRIYLYALCKIANLLIIEEQIHWQDVFLVLKHEFCEDVA
jgi:hypothetical protein